MFYLRGCQQGAGLDFGKAGGVDADPRAADSGRDPAAEGGCQLDDLGDGAGLVAGEARQLVLSEELHLRRVGRPASVLYDQTLPLPLLQDQP